MEGEVIDEARFVRMPERELIDHSARVSEKRSCANDKFYLRKLLEHGIFKV